MGHESALARDCHCALALGALARGTAGEAAHDERGDERVEETAARKARPRGAVAAECAQHRVRQAVCAKAVRHSEVRTRRHHAAQTARPERHRGSRSSRTAGGGCDALRREERDLDDERGGPRERRGVRDNEAEEREAEPRQHRALPRPPPRTHHCAEHALGLEPHERAQGTAAATA